MKAGVRLGLRRCEHTRCWTIDVTIREAGINEVGVRGLDSDFSSSQEAGLTKGCGDVRGQLHAQYMLPLRSPSPLCHHCSPITTLPLNPG